MLSEHSALIGQTTSPTDLTGILDERSADRRRTFARFLKPQWRRIPAYVAIALLGSAIPASTPLLIKHLIDDGIVAQSTTAIWTWTAAIVTVACIGFGLSLLEQLLISRISRTLSEHLQNTLLEHFHRVSIGYFTEHPSGEIVTRITSDTGAVQAGVATLATSGITNIASLLITVSIAVSVNWLISLVILTLTPVFIAVSRVINRRLKALRIASLDTSTEANSYLTERLTSDGVITSRLLRIHALQRKEFASLARRNTELGTQFDLTSRSLFTSLVLIGAISTAIVYGLGGASVVAGRMELGSVVALVTLLGRIVGPMNAVTTLPAQYSAMAAALDRIYSTLGSDTKPDNEETPQLRETASQIDGTNSRTNAIELSNVHYSYKGAEGSKDHAVEGVTLTVPAGKSVTIAGESGSGKTTLALLMSGVMEPSTGEVRVHAGMTLGMMPQFPTIFSGSIRYNLSLANPCASERQLLQACEAAQLNQLLARLPSGIDSQLGERGAGLSGGEKQRIALAQMILSDPDIVIFDEATAHLDPRTEQAVSEFLAHWNDKTYIFITHGAFGRTQSTQLISISRGRVVEK